MKRLYLGDIGCSEWSPFYMRATLGDFKMNWVLKHASLDLWKRKT